MKRRTGSTSHSDPIDDQSRASEKRYQHSAAIDRPRLLRLALQFSVLEMSALPGVPGADAIYRALASDAAFEREFAKANHVHKQALRAELADLLRRGRTADLSRIFVALCKLRNQTGAIEGESTTHYDFSRLSDEEVSQLDSILSKALRQSAETADTNEGGGNCDVIVRRYEELTGRSAKLERTGQEFAAAADHVLAARLTEESGNA